MYGHVRENQLVVKSSTSSSPSITGAKQYQWRNLKIEQFHATAFASTVEIAKMENTMGFTYMFCSSIYKSTACCYSKNDF